jgi:hypothetical protein
MSSTGWRPLPAREGVWWVINDHTGEFHRPQPCNYGPRGRAVAYRSLANAQRKADELNGVDSMVPGTARPRTHRSVDFVRGRPFTTNHHHPVRWHTLSAHFARFTAERRPYSRVYDALHKH